MARTVRDTNLETRAARSRLVVRKKPYWRAIHQGAHLGYYRGTRGGSWCARLLLEGGGYREHKLGIADDASDADGLAVLDFKQAQDAARTWFRAEEYRANGLSPERPGPYTVASAIEDYLTWYAGRRKALDETRQSANAHILPALGTVEVQRLTATRIRSWHDKLATAPARVRTRPGATPQQRPAATTDDAKRARRASANRILTILKAALNHAWREGRVPSDEAWRKVRPFQEVDAAVIRYLQEAECVRLVNACPPALRRIVQGALLTGCRYGELTALLVADVNFDADTIAVRTSKSGKPRHVALTAEGRRLFEQLTAGKPGAALVFTREDGAAWAKSHQHRPLKAACALAGVAPAISFHVLRHTYGSTLAMRGVPLAVIAKQLGHADTRMTERHYAHLAPNYVADTVRANFPTLGIVEETSVSRLPARF